MVVGNTANKVVGTAQYKDITDSANDMTPLGSSLYSLGFLSESEGWIKSSTNYLSGTKYETFYTKAVSMLNKPFAGGLIKDKAKEDYTDYDLVLDQIEQKFRLPLLNGQESLPGDKSEDLVLGATGMQYTAKKNGYLCLKKVAGVAGTEIHLATSKLTQSGYGHAVASEISAWVQMAKGDVATVTYTATGATNSFKFIEAQAIGDLYFKVGNALQAMQLIN